jgi:methylenetetrahydrofolate reductase (NADPH)
MVATAKRLADEGYPVMPHFPARIIKDEATLEDWIARYQGEAGVSQALLLAGGVANPHGDFDSSMQLMETGLFDKAGFTRLHVAGHPEGNRDIDPKGGTKQVDEALRGNRSFPSAPMRRWPSPRNSPLMPRRSSPGPTGCRRGHHLPVHIGIAGPAKLQTLIKFAIACGVGPSLKVLQKRAMDVSKLLLPYEPTDVLADLAAHKAANPDFNITNVHFFPLGGIKTNATWAIENGAASAAAPCPPT